MKERIITLGHRLIINSHENSIRIGFLNFILYTLLFLSLVFSIEIALILFGIGDIVLPWTSKALEIIKRFFF